MIYLSASSLINLQDGGYLDSTNFSCLSCLRFRHSVWYIESTESE